VLFEFVSIYYIDDFFDAGPVSGRQTHWAGFGAGVENAVVQFFRAQFGAGLANGVDFGVGHRIVVTDYRVVRGGDDFVIFNNGGTEGAAIAVGDAGFDFVKDGGPDL